MSKALKETIFLYQLSQDLYKGVSSRRVSLSEVDLNTFMDLSMKNNMFFYHAKTLLDSYAEGLSQEAISYIRDVVAKGEVALKKIEYSVSLLNECAGDYLLIKTYRGYPRIPSDLDVLVENFDKALDSLQNKGLKIRDIWKTHPEAVLINDKTHMIHLHGGLLWLNSQFMDRQLIFNNPRRVKFGVSEGKIPNIDADFLIHIAHINFEPLHITMSDLSYIYRISQDVDWEAVLNQAKKYNWSNTFKNTIAIMDGIYHRLYEERCPFHNFGLKHKPFNSDGDLILPKTLPRRHLINTLFEKRLFLQALAKFSKSCKVILAADAYSNFYEPPEKRYLAGTDNRVDYAAK